MQRRPRCRLYHSALTVAMPDRQVVVEMAPVVDTHGGRRGVVGEGAVVSPLLGRLRIFRYEVRRWEGGSIPDAWAAVDVIARQVPDDTARHLLELVPMVPTRVWGRDELRAGEMWNSNSITAWLLARSGLDPTSMGPPPGGRAPGWHAGLAVAARADQ